MKQLYKVCSVLGITIMGLLFVNASTGPGNTFGAGYTGASFDAGTCAGCHGGGSYTPSVTMQLLSGTTAVSSYIPNASYTLSINISTSTGSNPSYGFQVVAVRSANNANAGSWGNLPSGTQTAVISSRTYVEHSSPLSSGNISIPWTAPASGNGTVVFYMTGNVVNLDNTFFGDNPQSASLTVPVNPLPITWLSFDGRIQGGKALLQWITTSDIDNGVFILEKSNDGRNFKELAEIKSKPATEDKNIYSYTDSEVSAVNYYRIKHLDVSGEESTFKTIQLYANDFPEGIAYVKEDEVILLLSGVSKQNALVSIFSLDGRLLSSVQAALQVGTNTVRLPKPPTAGIYLIRVKSGDRIIYNGKLLSD